MISCASSSSRSKTSIRALARSISATFQDDGIARAPGGASSSIAAVSSLSAMDSVSDDSSAITVLTADPPNARPLGAVGANDRNASSATLSVATARRRCLDSRSSVRFNLSFRPRICLRASSLAPSLSSFNFSCEYLNAARSRVNVSTAFSASPARVSTTSRRFRSRVASSRNVAALSIIARMFRARPPSRHPRLARPVPPSVPRPRPRRRAHRARTSSSHHRARARPRSRPPAFARDRRARSTAQRSRHRLPSRPVRAAISTTFAPGRRRRRASSTS